MVTQGSWFDCILVHLLRLDFHMTREIIRILRQGRGPLFSDAEAVLLFEDREVFLFLIYWGAGLIIYLPESTVDGQHHQCSLVGK